MTSQLQIDKNSFQFHIIYIGMNPLKKDAATRTKEDMVHQARLCSTWTMEASKPSKPLRIPASSPSPITCGTVRPKSIRLSGKSKTWISKRPNVSCMPWRASSVAIPRRPKRLGRCEFPVSPTRSTRQISMSRPEENPRKRTIFAISKRTATPRPRMCLRCPRLRKRAS